MTLTLPACGLHHNVSFADYSAWEAINFSRLKAIRNTASKCKWEMEHPKEETPAMILGNALHTATLEPARFESMFHICPPCDRRTKEGKEIYAQESLKAEGKIMIRRGGDEKDERAMGQVESIRGMAQAIHGHSKASLLINGAGQNEVSMLWKDTETGLMCKARCDRVMPFALWGCDVIVELKSCRDAREFEFSRDVLARAYDVQGGCYYTGYKHLTGKAPAHVFIAVENFPPHDLMVHMLPDNWMQKGISDYRQMLNRYAECVKSGIWPGYEEEVTTLKLPGWANEAAYAD